MEVPLDYEVDFTGMSSDASWLISAFCCWFSYSIGVDGPRLNFWGLGKDR